MSFTVSPAFEQYYQPETMEEVLALLARCGQDARLLAGGTVLMNQMRGQKIAPRHIINISKVAGLDQIRVLENGALSVGTLAKLAAVTRSPEVAKGWALPREAVLEIGLVQVRNMATVAGNICRPVPSADSAVALLALDASVAIRGVKGERQTPMSEFLSGARKSMLADSEMVTEVRVPPLPAGAGTGFLKLHTPKVNAAALLVVQKGKCSEARIALGGVAATPIRAAKAEALLVGNALDDALIDRAGAAAESETNPESDVRASAEYRRDMSHVLVRRVVKIAWDRAQGKKGGDAVKQAINLMVCDATLKLDAGAFSLPPKEIMSKALDLWKEIFASSVTFFAIITCYYPGGFGCRARGLLWRPLLFRGMKKHVEKSLPHHRLR